MIEKTVAIMLTEEEFTELVQQVTDGLETTEMVDGTISIVHSEKAEELGEYINRPLAELLSEHFGEHIVSWHTDNCEYPTVFLICDSYNIG